VILPLDFYDRSCLTVAEELLGKFLVRRMGRRRLAGRIVEVEAYVGEADRACHARFGPTSRARTIFGPPGRAYVFFIYGRYHCFNAVTEPAGSPTAVLVRALEPAEGLDGGTDGPGKLCDALSITRAHDGAGLDGAGDLWIEDRGGPRVRAVATPRIGIDYAGAWAKKPWRLVDGESGWLSKKLRRRSRSGPR
jgi:DNA-3-methyladenine glycosylase